MDNTFIRKTYKLNGTFYIGIPIEIMQYFGWKKTSEIYLFIRDEKLIVTTIKNEIGYVPVTIKYIGNSFYIPIYRTIATHLNLKEKMNMLGQLDEAKNEYIITILNV